MKRRAGTFQEFKDYTLAVARGERRVEPGEPRVWCERIEGGESGAEGVQFASLEAGAKLLSAKNRVLLRTIAERQPKSVTELAAMTGRAEQNVLRTLNKLAAAGIVRLDRGEGRAIRPTRTSRSISWERVSLPATAARPRTSPIPPPPVGIVEHRRADAGGDDAVGEGGPDRLAVP
jgi:predicted transcriptional regulator